MRVTWRTGSVIGIACSMLVACGSDNSSTASSAATTSTPPVVDEEEDQAAAESALLQLSDFEPGWSEVPSSDDGDQDSMKRKIAECSGSDQDTGIDFGGALAKTGDITSPDGNQVIQETVSFASNVAAAAERMAILAAPEFAVCIRPIYEQFVEDMLEGTGTNVDRMTVGKLNVTPSGDNTVAYRITITASNGGLTQELYADIIVIQSGRALASPIFQSRNNPFSIDDTERYVALAASRLPAP